MKRLLKGLVRGGRVLGAAWLVALVVVHPVLLVAAALPHAWIFGGCVILAYAAEIVCRKRAPQALRLLATAHLGTGHRYIARDIALVLFLARAADQSARMLAAVTVGLVLLHGLRGVIVLLRRYVLARRRMPFRTRNVDLSELNLPASPPRQLLNHGVRRLLHLSLPAFAGAGVEIGLDVPAGAIVGIGIGMWYGLVVLAMMAWHAFRVRPMGNRNRLKRFIHEKILEYRPEVVLHFSHVTSVRNSAYQVDMWLSTLEQLDRRALIIIREAAHLRRIARTQLPIVCIEGGSDLLDFELPDLKVALYVGNVGKNIHLLRAAEVRHVFIGHGDSDKQSSVNPFNKVYDEIWVAGQAGRERYHRARVGIRDEAIVEVGRPQLASVQRSRPGGRMLTVLYAPTWEGWSSDMYLTSILRMGERMIGELLARSPQVRVIYKPHPLTGIRNVAVRTAHRNIVKLLADANTRRAAEPGWAAEVAQSQEQAVATQARTLEIESRMSELRSMPGYSGVGRPAGADPDVHAEFAACEMQWQEGYWAGAGWWCHRTVNGSRPDLYSCFNQADLLIADISSVVSDFIASGKPYVVCNIADEDEGAFRAQYTAVGGAYLLGSECAELAGILAAVEAPAADPLLDARRHTKEFLLGPDDPDAMTRFNNAVNVLARRRDAELAGAFGIGEINSTVIDPFIPRQLVRAEELALAASEPEPGLWEAAMPAPSIDRG